jgi:hypothetical protein
MQITLKTKNKNGDVLFDGVFSEEEFNHVVNAGVNVMLTLGHLPFKKVDQVTEIIIPEKTLIQ